MSGPRLLLGVLVALGAFIQVVGQERDVRLMTVDPGHFHAALVQKEMYPGVAPRVDVYAPDGPDLAAHLARVKAYNARGERPTSWQLEVHTGADYFERMLRERPGSVVVLSGRNRTKIDRVAASLKAGLHVLADKPWVLRSEDLPKVEAALADADAKGLVAYDIMTERFEITSMLQRALVNDAEVFGTPVKGTAAEPAVYMESVHHLMKVVSGAPNIRPPWFFDTAEQGEGLNDIGTHLVDLVQWTLFPGVGVDYRRDLEVIAAQRWPTVIPEADFRRVTNQPGFPADLAPRVSDGRLEYFCNTLVSYAIRGVHTKLNIIWDWEAPAGGGDTHFAYYRGTRSRVEVRQTKADGYRPELFVIPNTPADAPAVLAAVQKRFSVNQSAWRGIGVEPQSGAGVPAGGTGVPAGGTGELRITIPAALRTGHEAHFAEVMTNFLRYLKDRSALPAWERPNMLAKYYVTTTGTELSRKSPARAAPRIAPR